MTKMTMWTVYDHPSDHPNGYVARAWEIEPGRYVPTSTAIVADDLETLRAMLRDEGLMCFKRHATDDPVIIEVWL